VLFDARDGDRVVLEAESFVFIVNQGLPQPDGEADLLPEWDVMVVPMVILAVLYAVGDLQSRQTLLLQVFELVELLDILVVV